MSMTEPLPVGGQYGVAEWQDYVNNWREADAEFLQSRSILRFATTAERNDAYPSAPAAGQFIYNNQVGHLEYSTGSAWAAYRGLPNFLTKTTDTASTTTLSHTGASGAGLVFAPAYVEANTDFRVRGGVLTATATLVSIKTGAATANLTTNATHLVSSIPLSMPSITLTGGGTVFTASGAISVGSLTTPQVTATNVSVSGTLSGGVLNGSSGTIGSVGLASGRVTATNGLVSDSGYFYGGTSASVMRFRNAGSGALGPAYVQVTQDYAQINGNPIIYLDGQVRFRGGENVNWYDSGGTFRGYVSPVVYSASDPGAANYPPGALWIS